MNARTAAARIKAAAKTVIKNSDREGEAVALTEVIHVNSFRGVNEPLPWWVVSADPTRKVFEKFKSEVEANKYSNNLNAKDRTMPWIQTAEGKIFDLYEPKSESVEPETIAKVLSRTPRFGGHWKNGVEWYSVAQHSVLVSELLPKHLQLAGLLHDAHEAYWGFGDVLRPAKIMHREIHLFLKAHAQRVDGAIAEKFGFSQILFKHHLIKNADNVMLATEARDVMTTPPAPWETLPGPLPGHINPVGISEAYQMFRERFETLWMEHISTTSGTGKNDCQTAKASHAG